MNLTVGRYKIRELAVKWPASADMFLGSRVEGSASEAEFQVVNAVDLPSRNGRMVALLYTG